MNTLVSLEAEAKDFIQRHNDGKTGFAAKEPYENILKLIDLVRKKDEALQTIERAKRVIKEANTGVNFISLDRLYEICGIADEALALTEELK